MYGDEGDPRRVSGGGYRSTGVHRRRGIWGGKGGVNVAKRGMVCEEDEWVVRLREGRKVETVYFSSSLFLHTHTSHTTQPHNTNSPLHITLTNTHPVAPPPCLTLSFFLLLPSSLLLLPSYKVFNKDSLEDHSRREARRGDVQSQ